MSRDAPEMAFTAASLPLAKKKNNKNAAKEKVKTIIVSVGRQGGREREGEEELHVAAFVLIFIF